MYVLPDGFHRRFIDEADRDSKPFVWTAKPRKILAEQAAGDYKREL
jgi:hypothetical protein